MRITLAVTTIRLRTATTMRTVITTIRPCLSTRMVMARNAARAKRR